MRCIWVFAAVHDLRQLWAAASAKEALVMIAEKRQLFFSFFHELYVICGRKELS